MGNYLWTNKSVEGEKIVKIRYSTDDEIGAGSEGTLVFRGTYEGMFPAAPREVAIKRIQKISPIKIVRAELETLAKADRHENVVRYYCLEQDQHFYYIALDLYETTLFKFVTDEVLDCQQGIDILEKTTNGLAYLHDKGIIHRDVKPQNILISSKSGPNVQVAITDFGMSKEIPLGRTSVTCSAVSGSVGWLAPEIIVISKSISQVLNDVVGKDISQVLNEAIQVKRTSQELDEVNGISKKISQSSDVFSLGCVYYFVLTNGGHPFGSDPVDRDNRILSGNFNLDSLLSNKEGSLYCPMLEKMLDKKRTNRPSVETILKHPMFWTRETKCDFLAQVSDAIEGRTAHNSPIVKKLEDCAATIVSGDWSNFVDNEIVQENLSNLKRFLSKSQWEKMRDKKSDYYEKIQNLLRLIRNMASHYNDKKFPEHVRQILRGDMEENLPAGVYITQYFTTRFPLLLAYVYYSMEEFKADSAPMANFYDRTFNYGVRYTPSV